MASDADDVPPPRRSVSRTRRILASPGLSLALVMVTLGLLAGGLTAYYEYTRPPTYRSTAALLIDQPHQIATALDDGVVNKLARVRVKYVGLVGTEGFDRPLATQTGQSLGVVHNAVRATADPDSLLVLMSATLRNPSDAEALATAAADYLVSSTSSDQTAEG